MIATPGRRRARRVLLRAIARAQETGIGVATPLVTDYTNTIPAQAQTPFPGDERLETRLRRQELAPGIHDAFVQFSRAVFADGALAEKTKPLIAVAVAHVTQSPYCIDGHTRLAQRKGATPEEIMEVIWVAAEMRAGGAYAHSTLALYAMDEAAGAKSGRVDQADRDEK